MSNYRLKIELLSDLCVSDGGVYNSSLDTDVCYDTYGLPYIPAKRLRGCLRECAQELNDWGIGMPAEELFGNEKNPSKVRIGNACLENAESKKQIISGANHAIFHQQNVLGCYTSYRTQTAINYETGVADDNSLRTMRVVNKGICFYVDVTVEDGCEAFFKQCCQTLRHMGVARTRGLGEVAVSLKAGAEQGANPVKKTSYEEGATCLKYTLFLEEPVICRSVQNGEIKSADFIEGGKILGLLAQHLKEAGKDYKEFVNGAGLRCTYAYPALGNERMTEVPACFFAIKNNKEDYVNKAYEDWRNDARETEEKGLQLNSMKHCYVREADEKLHKYSVEIEKRYHHRRPEDKSYGRTTETGENSGFYQMSSIAPGQRFAGYIYGEPDKIKELYELLKASEVKHIGYSKNAEYGKVIMEELHGVKTEEDKVCVEKTFDVARYLLVKLEAPAIVYSQNAMYSVDVADLHEEIKCALKLPEHIAFSAEPAKQFVNYTSIGGFNTTWGMRKPTQDAFDKGTVLMYKLAPEMEFVVPQNGFLGERNEEGYGEFSVQLIKKLGDNNEGYVMKYYKAGGKAVEESLYTLNMTDEFVKNICDRLFEEFIRVDASNKAKDHKIAEALRPTVNNLLSMCKEEKTVAGVKTSAEERFQKAGEGKAAKWAAAEAVFKKIPGADTIKGKFCKSYKLEGFDYDAENCGHRYLEAYLLALKYRIRQETAREAKKGGSRNEQ